MALELDDEVLGWLATLSQRGDPPPWTASVEGRDHDSGDSFIVSGMPDDRREDIYVTRDSGPASTADLDLIAAARTYLPILVAEVQRLRMTPRADVRQSGRPRDRLAARPGRLGMDE